MDMSSKAKHIAQCLELAVLLEVSAPKPGNVTVTADFEKTRYDHFLASAVAACSSFESAAKRGLGVSTGRINAAKVRLGLLIRNCVEDIKSWQHGGNTLLGTVILLMPIAVAAGMEPEQDKFRFRQLRESLKKVVESTTPQDAVDLYEAIRIANPGGLGRRPDLDINDPTSSNRIIRERISLYDVFRLAEKYDTICSEWANNYPVTAELAYPSLARKLEDGSNAGEAIVQAFLEVLAKVPDTFIARKTSVEKARQISLKAREIVELGGVDTLSGKKSLSVFDRELRTHGNLLNPGTTADIIAAALALVILGGYRP